LSCLLFSCGTFDVPTFTFTRRFAIARCVACCPRSPLVLCTLHCSPFILLLRSCGLLFPLFNKTFLHCTARLTSLLLCAHLLRLHSLVAFPLPCSLWFILFHMHAPHLSLVLPGHFPPFHLPGRAAVRQQTKVIWVWIMQKRRCGRRRELPLTSRRVSRNFTGQNW